ncbi:hypothetical protein HHK36_021998 [Tetracentron sinense]|uniref:Uncharacterized protein n=1 Tax=Tetracentron sinense TaxID=13715 RepID=A0A834YMD5_TETSI|nr:hypothetical protein HHK36_021998 [Tetracentron sinense]
MEKGVGSFGLTVEFGAFVYDLVIFLLKFSGVNGLGDLQFILAKKGPLGTIWIAAHLERKLRKNQVADTDIGVSVDSILFPEVPIALRLSSHLLLGVVRIYSRKVNYLFHDCSEALLKVKQAFRSTAVDLPPEESTAPYHSITLPETFDLDDFELPDSELFQSYVDHHVSTREQITLEDTMEGVVYSTSQFGLDERFGDGDTSQIGLDLDEDLFLDKVASPGHAVVLLALEEDADPRASGQPMTPLTNMDIDEDQNDEERTVETSKVMQADGSGDQVEGTSVNLSTDLIGCVQAPSTPGAAKEANPANVQEVPALNLSDITSLPDSVEVVMPDVSCNVESEDRNSTELVAKKGLGDPSSKPDLHFGNPNAVDCSLLNDKSSDTYLHMPTWGNVSVSDGLKITQVKLQGEFLSTAETMGPMSSDTACSVSSSISVLAESLKPISPVSECSNRIIASADGQEKTEIISNKDSILSSIYQTRAEDIGPQGISSDTTAASPSCSHQASTLEEPCSKPLSIVEVIPTKSNLTSHCQLILEDMSESDHFPHKETSDSETFRDVEIVGDVDKLCSSSNALPSSAHCLLGSAGRHELENVEAKGSLQPQAFKILNHDRTNEMPCAQSHVLQACNSHMNRSDVLSLEDGNLVEVVPDLPSRGVGLCSLETSGRWEELHASGVSAKVQGEGWHTTDVTDTVLKVSHILEASPCEDIQPDLGKSDECLDNVMSRDTQLDNCSASSELPAPEKLLSAPEGIYGLPHDLLVESAPEKEALWPLSEHEGSGNGFKVLSGKKRRLMESTPVLQSGNSAKLSGVLRFKITADSIPDDDDLLSSILVGRTAVLKMRPTPPPLEVAYSKRPRLAPRVSASKRKVLLDDTMVLHGDTIRQQLTSTEDIRRIRKKVPCTRTEIWMMQKHLLEDEIFSESIFTGTSTELICLHNQSYDLRKVSQNDENYTSLEVVKDMKLSVSTVVMKETCLEGNTELRVLSNGEEAQYAETLVQSANQQGEEHVIGTLGCDSQLQTEVLTDISSHDPSKDGNLGEIAEIEIGRGDVEITDVVDRALALGAELPSLFGPLSRDCCNISPTIESSPIVKNNGTEATLQNDVSCLPPDQKLDIQFVETDASVMDTRDDKVVNANEVAEVNEENLILFEGASGARDRSTLEETEGGGSIHQQYQVDLRENTYIPITVPTLDNCSVEISKDVLTDSSISTEHANSSLPDMSPGTGGQINRFVVNGDQSMEEIRTHEVGVLNESEVLTRKVGYDEENPSSKPVFSEEPQRDSSCPLELNLGMKVAPLNEGENLDCQDDYPKSNVDAEITALDNAAIRDCGIIYNEVSLYCSHPKNVFASFVKNISLAMILFLADVVQDFGNVIVGNDTEFLNADDDDVVEEEDNGMPSAEEAHFIENSGWSSRTRAVAKYLHTLFDKEAGNGRKVLPVNNLLAGKTRKEASRMFFETLLTKRWWIQINDSVPYCKKQHG